MNIEKLGRKSLLLGKQLSELRKKQGLSQYALAERLGFSRGQLANYEQGQREPDFKTLQTHQQQKHGHTQQYQRLFPKYRKP